jgi:MSHA biogenesis protein MshP
MRSGRQQRGFLIIAGIFLIVVLAGLAVYLGTVTSTSQAASAADLNSARAYQAARAGAEWAVYLILDPEAAGSNAGSLEIQCAGGSASRTLALGSTLPEFSVAVSCTSTAFTEGATALRTYAIEATACNAPPCPNTATTNTTYVERKVSLTLTK